MEIAKDEALLAPTPEPIGNEKIVDRTETKSPKRIINKRGYKKRVLWIRMHRVIKTQLN
jgi:hypothetical protein